MEEQYYDCRDKRDAALKLIEMVGRIVPDLPERGGFKPKFSEETVRYENAYGMKYNIWLKAKSFCNDLRKDEGEDSRYVEILMVSDGEGYMAALPFLSGHKDEMMQKFQNETSPERYEGMIDKLIRDLRDV